MLNPRGLFTWKGLTLVVVAVMLFALAATDGRRSTHEKLLAAYDRDSKEVLSILDATGARDVQMGAEVHVRTTSRLQSFSVSSDFWLNERGREKFVSEALRRGWQQRGPASRLCRAESEMDVDYRLRGAHVGKAFVLLRVRESGNVCETVNR